MSTIIRVSRTNTIEKGGTPLAPTLEELKALNEREELLRLLRHAKDVPDDVLIAVSYMLYNLKRTMKKKGK